MQVASHHLLEASNPIAIRKKTELTYSRVNSNSSRSAATVSLASLRAPMSTPGRHCRHAGAAHANSCSMSCRRVATQRVHVLVVEIYAPPKNKGKYFARLFCCSGNAWQHVGTTAGEWLRATSVSLVRSRDTLVSRFLNEQ